MAGRMVIHRDVVLKFAKGPKVQSRLEQIAEGGAAGARRRVAVDTGHLRSRIKVTSGPGFARWGVDGVDYAIPQEYGTWKMKAHPFMRPSVNDAVRAGNRGR